MRSQVVIDSQTVAGAGQTLSSWEGLEELYRSSRDDVYAYVFTLLRERAAAEDVTAQAFERMSATLVDGYRRSGADVVFDTVGGETTASLVGAVAEGGIIVTIAGAPPTAAAAQRAARAELLISRTDTDQLARVAALVEAGDVRVEIAEGLRLDEAARAHELSESGHVRGKLVLTV